MSKPTTYYLHTLDGRPAYFVPGQGICFIMFYGAASPLCRSLKQIRAEQAEDDRICREKNITPVTKGHLRVRLP